MRDDMLKRLDNASEFFIMTPMVKQLQDTLKQWTWCGLIGGVVVGEARTGKTLAIRSSEKGITSRLGENIPVFRISIAERDVKTIRSVFARIALSLGFEVKTRDTSESLAVLVKVFLADASMINKTRQVILIIDEAQYLIVDQMSVFAEIYNDLFDMRHNCTIFFIANENQFGPIAKELLKEENKYLRERFFDHIHHFYGLRNAKEVKDCLKQYDQYLIHDSENITATEYYCPSLYQSGWRLSNIATTMWKIYYKLYMVPLKHRSWNMSQFVRTTNILLMDYLPHYEDELDDALIKGLIIRSLEAAAIKPSIQQFVKQAC